ncbi:cysteinyl leukotriene receptor 2-like isoform X1 [Oncorhynchus keta]|uniref:cysteinyl leukotriene receptor 2-like isoform X1 n=1 Tax=Oncorhynchus keta TaxID=8018 RepID=UPI0015FDFAE8|nr:cysteinyl leukotriene receptor 2-like isoform X1 [Oncorhynchus keta]
MIVIIMCLCLSPAPWLETSHWLDSTLPPVTLPLSNHTVKTLTSNQSCSGEDEVFKYRAYTVTYLLVFPIALLFNSGALFVFLRLKSKRSPSSILMTNLALSDACFSLTLPFRLAYYFRGAHWDLPDWLCRLCVFCFYLNLYTSILFLTGLSVLRWLAVLKPLHHRALATPHRASLACLGIWLFVGGTSVPFLFSGTRVRAGLTRCFEPRNSATWKRIFILNYVGVTFGFLIPFVTILGCYGSIIRRLTATAISQKLQTGSLKSSHGRRHRQSLCLVAMVICTFLLCFLPYHVARSMHLHAVVGGWGCVVTATQQRVLVVTLCLAAANSVLNPLLYYCAGESFRTTIRNASSRRRSLSSLTQGSLLYSHRKRSIPTKPTMLDTPLAQPLSLPESMPDTLSPVNNSP